LLQALLLLFCPVAAVCAGVVTFDDMQIMLRQLAGSSLSDEDINTLVKRALTEAGAPHGLTLQQFQQTLSAQELAGMVVEVPVEL
jgi:serine/threonine-protein phosphatase 2B regulatory subunit